MRNIGLKIAIVAWVVLIITTSLNLWWKMERIEKYDEMYNEDSVKVELNEITPPWPIKVSEVKFDKTKYMVTCENGLVYYTDNKPNIGDTAFYMTNDEFLIEKDGDTLEFTR